MEKVEKRRVRLRSPSHKALKRSMKSRGPVLCSTSTEPQLKRKRSPDLILQAYTPLLTHSSSLPPTGWTIPRTRAKDGDGC